MAVAATNSWAPTSCAFGSHQCKHNQLRGAWAALARLKGWTAAIEQLVATGADAARQADPHHTSPAGVHLVFCAALHDEAPGTRLTTCTARPWPRRPSTSPPRRVCFPPASGSGQLPILWLGPNWGLLACSSCIPYFRKWQGRTMGLDTPPWGSRCQSFYRSLAPQLQNCTGAVAHVSQLQPAALALGWMNCLHAAMTTRDPHLPSPNR